MDVAELPLLALPNVLLYPGAMLPLHVFEPRYLQMVEEMERSGERRLVLGLLRPGWEEDYFERPRVHALAGLGEVLQVHRSAEGHCNVLVRGEGRVRILGEVPGEALRRVRIEEVQEIPVADPAEEQRLARRLRQSLIEFAEGSLVLPGRAPLSYLADVVLVAMPLDLEVRQELFAELDVERRARAVLAAAEEVLRNRRDVDQALRRAGPASWN